MMQTGLLVFVAIVSLLGWLGLLVWMAGNVMDSQGSNAWLLGIGAVVVFALPFAIGIPLSMAQDAKPFDGYVYKKTYTPAYTSMILAGKVMIPQYHPPRWNFVLNATDSTDQRSCDVPEQTWNEVELGREFHCGGF